MQKTTMAIGDVTAAAVLAEPVLDPHHQVLLSAGTLLTPSRVDGLRQRGIVSVVIVDTRDPGVPQADTVALEALCDARLQYLFRQARRSGQDNPLLQLVARYRQGELS
jgi:hypothetical protein